MDKLRKLKEITKVLLKRPALLGKVLEDNDHWAEFVRKKYHLDAGLPVIDAKDLFGDFSGQVTPYASLDGSSLPTDLLLLRKLAGTFPECSYFEIGTWRGESVANVAQVAGKCYTLNLSPEQMRGRKLPENYIGLHRFFSKDLTNVVHLEGDSREFDFSSLDKKFDLVFIDGDHHYEMVKNDTRKVFEHLIHPGTIVVWHDYAYNPEKIRFEVLAAILEALPDDLHKRIYHVNNTLCAMFINKDILSHPFHSPTTPTNHFTLNITQNST